MNSSRSSDSTNHHHQQQPHFDSTVPFKPYTTDTNNTQPSETFIESFFFKPSFQSNLDEQSYKELPTGKVVEALIERANRLREDMIKSSLQKPTTVGNDTRPIDSVLLNNNNNNSNHLSTRYENQSLDIANDDIDPLLDTDNVFDLLGIKPSMKAAGDLNNSTDSILTDLEGLENEQSLLDELLYGAEANAGATTDNHRPRTTNKNHPRGKPPTGRSPSPSMARVGGLVNRSRSSRSRSLAQSSDSDTASRVSFDMPSSDLDDSGNGKNEIFSHIFRFYSLYFFSESHNDDDQLGTERIQLLSHIRTARVRIELLHLNALNNGRESPSHSSFGRTNKSKRAT